MKKIEIHKLKSRGLPWRSKSSSINWRSWRPAAFGEASDRTVPIFLFITFSWSARSRRFEEAVLSKKQVVQELNRRFIPVRVDAGLRPDIRDRYASNGLPSIVLLTPEGDIITDHHLVREKELLSFLDEHARLFADRRPENIFDFQESRRKMLFLEFDSAKYRLPTEQDAAHLVSTLVNSYDKLSGNFGERKNAPNPAGIELLLTMSSARPELLEIAKEVLDKMVSGGLYDPANGGFYRASTRNNWQSPTSEKLLSVNGSLISLYLQAYRLTRSHVYHKAAFESLAFVETQMVDEELGVFYAGVFGKPENENAGRRIDSTVYSDENHQMAIAYLDAYDVCGDPRYLERALAVLDFIWSRCFDADEGMAHYLKDETPRLFGRLNDQAWAALALAKAYAATGERGHIIRALEVIDVACSNLHDSGSFYDTIFDPDAPGLLKMRLRPVEGNALLVKALASIYALTGDSNCASLAKEVIGTLKVDTTHPSPEVSLYAIAILSACSLSNSGRQAA